MSCKKFSPPEGTTFSCANHYEDRVHWCSPCLVNVLDKAEQLLHRAMSHVYRQQHRGAHEQDRADAVSLLTDFTEAGYLRGVQGLRMAEKGRIDDM